MARTRLQAREEASSGFLARHGNVYVYVPNLIGAAAVANRSNFAAAAARRRCQTLHCPCCSLVLLLQAMHAWPPLCLPSGSRCVTQQSAAWHTLLRLCAMSWTVATLASSTNAPPSGPVSCLGSQGNHF